MKTKPLLLSVFVFAFVLVFIFFISLRELLTIDLLLNYYNTINLYISNNILKSIIVFVITYAFLVFLNFPLVSLLSLSGGLFFGTWLGGVLVLISATLGSLIFFIIAKYFFYDFFKKKIMKHLIKLEYYFKKNEISFLFILRLVPALPFVIQTLIAACFGANNIKFIFATFFGIAPATFIITNIGSNIHSIIKNGESFGIHLIYQPKYLLPIILLLLLVILGTFIKNKIN